MTDASHSPGQWPLERLTKAALALSLILFFARMSVASAIGFSDDEALYATYALYRQASYVDHPGLMGWLGALLAGADGVPSSLVAHRFTAVAATTIPWLAGLVVRAAGGSWRGVLSTVIALLIVPLWAVGLFGFTPEVPLAFFWLAAAALAALAIRAEPKSARAFGATVGAGLATGLACMTKVSGLALAAALLLAWWSRPLRGRWRTTAPYAALLVGALPAVPLLMREESLGFPLLRHHLLHNELSVGLALRNLGVLLGGQLVYLVVFGVVAAVLLAVDLGRHARRDPVARMLVCTSYLPFAALAVLVVLSRQAQPHWLAPAYLSLAVYLGLRLDSAPSPVPVRLKWATAISSMVAVALVFALVRFPVAAPLLGTKYKPKLDPTNDLYVWRPGVMLVNEALNDARDAGVQDPVLVGAHWSVCAQLQAAFGTGQRVGCYSEGDDFHAFFPRAQWSRAPALLYVTDDRFPEDYQKRFPDRAVQSVQRLGIRRGGALVRTIRVLRLGRAGAG